MARLNRRRLWVFIAALAATLSVAGGQDQPRAARPPERPVDRTQTPLRISFISYANPQQVARDTAAICEYLEPYLGVPVEGSVSTDYGSSIEAMRYGRADVAFVDPLAFMMAHEQIGARPLLLEVYSGGEPAYQSCIWVRTDSGIETLQDLRGRTIAFADQVDMSGHLLPRDIFVKQGLLRQGQLEGDFFKQVYFAGGDEQAVRAVLNGFVDAAGVSQFSYLLLRPAERKEVKVIARSVVSPSHLAMVRKGLAEPTVDRLKQALLSLDPQAPSDKKILNKLYGVEGYVEAELSDFAEVARIAARYGFVKKSELFQKPAENPTGAPRPPEKGGG